MIIIIRTSPKNKPVQHRQTTWGCTQIKRGLLGFKISDWQTVERILGCRCSAKTFSALKREEEKDAQSGKDYLVAEGLGSSGLISWLAQDSHITLAKVNSSVCATAPPSLHGFPLSSTTLSLFLSLLSASPAESINSAVYTQLLISDFSLSGFDRLWFDLFLFVLCPATSSRAYGWYHNKNKIHSWVFESFCVKKKQPNNTEVLCFW